MKEKEYNTIINFINSNNLFYNALENDNIYKDFNIIVELIILYFQINHLYISLLNKNEINILEKLINAHFYIQENKIIIEDSTFSLEYFLLIINKIESKKSHNNISKIVKFSPSKERANTNNEEGKIINLSTYIKERFYTMKEKSYIFSRILEVNNETISYINETNNNFTCLINDIIKKYLSGDDFKYDIKYLKIIYTYLSLYPFINYAQGKYQVPFLNLNLPQERIGISKITSSNKDLIKLEEKEVKLLNSRKKLIHQKEFLELFCQPDDPELSKIQNKILEIDNERLDNFYEIYCFKHSKQFYNETLLTYIYMSFIEGNIEINETFSNPVINIFYINDNKVEFYCAMHLSVLISLIKSDVLLPQEPGRKLKLEAKNG